MSVIRFFCSLCNSVVKNGETHQCAFRKEDESENKSRPVRTEELDGNKGDEKTEEYGGNSHKRIDNTSKAAPLAEYSSQASTSRAAGNHDVPEGSSDEPLDLTNRSVPTPPSLHGANSDRRVDAEKKPTELQQDAEAGPSTIRHHSTGPGGGTQYACGSCTFRSKHKYSFQRHLKTHSDERRFFCDKCGKRFIRNENLIRHMRTHTGENSERRVNAKRKSIKLQQESEAGPSTIRHHSTGPGGETQYACGSCTFRSKNKCSFGRHLRTHLGERRFLCDRCGKRFIRKQHLIMHMRTHTGEKPYGCDTCGNRFTKQHHLKRHVRTHT